MESAAFACNGRCGMNDTEINRLESRIKDLENRMAEKDTQFAVINTKLSAILWGVGVTGTAMVGILLKMLFGV